MSGVSRDEQQKIYDQRRRDVLPKHGSQLVEISYKDLNNDSRKRLIRSRQEDIVIIRRLLSMAQNENQTVEHKNTDKEKEKITSRIKCQLKTEQTWIFSPDTNVADYITLREFDEI